MIDVHIPEGSVESVPQMEKFITGGLDAVVLQATRSEVYPGSICMQITGNSRDVAIAVDRASRIGGVVD